MPNRPRIVVLGRQGSGKGTQCARLAAHLAIPHVSTGDLFREAVRDGSPVGRRVAGILDLGGLVPDELVIDVVRERAEANDLAATGYVLDGFPRTVAQAEAFFGTTELGTTLTADALTAGTHRRGPGVDVALEIQVPVEEVVDRISKRRVCPLDGWTTTVADPAVESVPCPDGHAAVQRSDDTPDAVRRRLALYDTETGPLAPWFAERVAFVAVDGTGPAEAVFGRIVDGLEPVFDRSATPT